MSSTKKPTPVKTTAAASDDNVVDATIKNVPVRSGKTGATASGQTFKKKKIVTVPVLKLEANKPIYVRVESAMTVSTQVKQKEVGGKVMDPATVMHCTDLNTDEECTVIVGKALEGTFNETYPSNGYVGKCFEIVNAGKIGDKKYNTYRVAEIELDE